MERIHKLPFILACIAAIAAGAASYVAHVESQYIYLRMAVMMLVFFIIGLYAKNTILSIKKEVQIKKLEQKKAEEQQLRQQREEQKNSSTASVQQAMQQEKQIHKVDLVAEDAGDDFEPLAMSKVISSKVKE